MDLVVREGLDLAPVVDERPLLREVDALPTSPRSILFLARRAFTNPGAGGSELLIDELASGLGREGYDVSLMAGGPVAPRPLYKVVRSGGPYWQYLRVPFGYWRSFRSVDLVVEVCNGMPFLAPAWRRGPSLCLVNHVHTEQWSSVFNPAVAAFGRTMEAKVMPLVHRHSLFVTVSNSTRQSLRELGVDDERIREIPQGVSMPGPILDPSPTPMFVAIGRLVPYKQVDLLLDMWKRVRPVTGGKLVVIGEGPERSRLEELAGEGVEFTGFVSESEKHRILCQSWLLVHPASWEGWGLVITEAAVRGTPSLGFDVPGVRDSISDGTTGLLANNPAAFERAWIDLTADTSRRLAFGQAAKERAMTTTWDTTAKAFAGFAAEAVELHTLRRKHTS